MLKVIKRIFKEEKVNAPNVINELLAEKYKSFTMIPKQIFRMNLELIWGLMEIEGAVVECGVWRGGMIAAMAEVLGTGRSYYLFDSFEGLPPAKEIDGEAAKKWQENTTNPKYYDNCKAEMSFAIDAMRMALPEKFNDVFIIKGWFEETLIEDNLPKKIAVLRLDADWYDSTLTCLDALYDRVVGNGLIIIDDYYTWDGCSKAVHDFLSRNHCSERVFQWQNNIAYIKKI